MKLSALASLGLAVLLLASPVVFSDAGHSPLRPLVSYYDPSLQSALESAVNAQPAWKRLIDQGRMAVCLADLSGEEPRYARINGSSMMYAASLPKIAILLSVYASFEDGSLKETEKLHSDLHDMISVSSNAAATRLIDAVGMQKIQRVLRDPRYRFYDERSGGGLWVGKRYAKTGLRIGDPVHNISHGATAYQVCRFYYLVSNGQMISEKRSAQMMADLKDPHIYHKFVAALRDRSMDLELYRKSGTWRQWHSDSVLVRGPSWRNYILVGLVQSSSGEQILRSLVSVAESVIQPAHRLRATRESTNTTARSPA